MAAGHLGELWAPCADVVSLLIIVLQQGFPKLSGGRERERERERERDGTQENCSGRLAGRLSGAVDGLITAAKAYDHPRVTNPVSAAQQQAAYLLALYNPKFLEACRCMCHGQLLCPVQPPDSPPSLSRSIQYYNLYYKCPRFWLTFWAFAVLSASTLKTQAGACVTDIAIPGPKISSSITQA